MNVRGGCAKSRYEIQGRDNDEIRDYSLFADTDTGVQYSLEIQITVESTTEYYHSTGAVQIYSTR